MSSNKVSISFKGRNAPKKEEREEKVILGGRYALQKELGRGGVGEVLLAQDLQLERLVAVKRIHVQVGESSERAQIATSEARRLARLQHPNIVTVFDVLEHQGDVLMVMEYLSGHTLEDLEAPLTLEDFLNVARQSLSGLSAAHTIGMIHLDIKSTNLMLTWLSTGQLQLKLLDFGLATMMEQLTPDQGEEEEGVLGSIYTMAPEQLERGPVDVRTDLYSLGCVYYHALTRKDPFRGDTVEAIIDAHLSHDVRPLSARRPDLPPALCAAVERMMARRPEDRPPSAAVALAEIVGSLSSANALKNLRAADRVDSPEAKPEEEICLPDANRLAAFVGKSAAVLGVVERISENAPGTVRIIDFEGVPHNTFSVIVTLKTGHAEFERDQMEKLVGRRIRVTGTVSEFHGCPQMVVDLPSQITVCEGKKR